MLSSKANSAAPTRCRPSWMSAMLHSRMPAKNSSSLHLLHHPKGPQEMQEQTLTYTAFRTGHDAGLLVRHSLTTAHTDDRQLGLRKRTPQ